MKLFVHLVLCLSLMTALGLPATAGEYTAMTAPLPPYSINKGLRVKGIAVDTLAVIMTLSGVPMESRDVKLMLWSHAFKITEAGPHKIMLNVPRTPNIESLFKWVGPIHVSKYVVIGRKNGKNINTLADLNNYKVGTIRDSLPEKALLASGVKKSALASSVTHVIPLKKLDNRMIDYFAHADTSTLYLMKAMGMKASKFEILHTYLEVPLYYAFSKDTDDEFIKKLNINLANLKTPGSDGKSRFDKIAAKYLPNNVLK